MDQSTPDPDIGVGTKLELPLWLAKYLHRDARGIVSVETPKTYRESYRQILAADPSVVDLHRLGPHFYLAGGKLAVLNLPDTQDVLKTLLKVCLRVGKRGCSEMEKYICNRNLKLKKRVFSKMS